MNIKQNKQKTKNIKKNT